MPSGSSPNGGTNDATAPAAPSPKFKMSPRLGAKAAGGVPPPAMSLASPGSAITQRSAGSGGVKIIGGQRSPGSGQRGGVFPAVPPGSATKCDWGKPAGTPSDKGSPKNGESTTGKVTISSTTAGGNSSSNKQEEPEFNYSEMFAAANSSGTKSRVTRRRKHLPEHYTEADAKHDAYAKKIAPKLVEALSVDMETEVDPEGFTKKAKDIAYRLAHLVSLKEGEAGHDIILRLVNAFKDPKNLKLRTDVVDEVIPPEIVVKLPENKLLDIEERKKIAKERREHAKEANITDASHPKGTLVTGVVKCPNCGHTKAWVEERLTAEMEDAQTHYMCASCHTKFMA